MGWHDTAANGGAGQPTYLIESRGRKMQVPTCVGVLWLWLGNGAGERGGGGPAAGEGRVVLHGRGGRRPSAGETQLPSLLHQHLLQLQCAAPRQPTMPAHSPRGSDLIALCYPWKGSAPSSAS